MSERSDAWREAAEYAAAVAGVGDNAARDRGVSVDRIHVMQEHFNLLRAGDPDAFYVVIQRYTTPASQAVARCIALRADTEDEKAMQDEPTNPHGFEVPDEAYPTPVPEE